MLVFDYVGDRYLRGADDAPTEWPEIYHADDGDISVIDWRTQRDSPVPGTEMSVLRFTAEVCDARTGEVVVEAHAYSKLIVPDALRVQQFADAGLELTNVGSAADLSPYHRSRIAERGDLGMLGEPDCFYRAVKG
ncbi:hypothetical protein QMK19_20655 [Streptomyces sp. H10-C2]|uniref:hypothetical protein n=1 Tax=unclassified Streptomyces TaxID=2593676 RepID=UPI0024BA2A24|nr:MULTISPECIES: hypothetical protein [unclassified Streptomyces]MDJ0340704.1 hypothetical protein [Streptomyces sp. PH10-H1]MDJ0372024.1 hypothetical protein [Streptomyces sp. H10-C2]